MGREKEQGTVMNQNEKDIEAYNEWFDENVCDRVIATSASSYHEYKDIFLAGIQYERNRQSESGNFGKWYSENRIRLSENNPPGNHGAKMFGNEALLEAYEQGMKDAKEGV